MELVQADLLKSHSFSREMDTDVMERLTKGLYAQKRKRAAPGGSSKRMRVDGPSFEVLNVPMIAFEVISGIEVLPIIGAASEQSGHHILAYLKRINHQEVEALKIHGDLQAEIDYLQGKIAEVEHLTEEKAVKNENLQRAL
ncbi:hypothetical protein COCNU_scaffold003742G000020 [Cocos nucifera]|nr:hypothetical protein [Cocos nucifera]